MFFSYDMAMVGWLGAPFHPQLLISGSRLSITDAKGTVVATIDADGGTALWNLTDNAGKRVPTGRYTIVATPANGSEGTTVGRIDVIR